MSFFGPDKLKSFEKIMDRPIEAGAIREISGLNIPTLLIEAKGIQDFGIGQLSTNLKNIVRQYSDTFVGYPIDISVRARPGMVEKMQELSIQLATKIQEYKDKESTKRFERFKWIIGTILTVLGLGFVSSHIEKCASSSNTEKPAEQSPIIGPTQRPTGQGK